ncbi:MAG TPA: rRNA maturation RNase YbeY [Gemmatimonadaceae bacterium]|jgi:probable rRNA maturation factor
MSIDVFVDAEGVRSPLGRDAVARIAQGALRAEKVRDAMLSITMLSRRAMAKANSTHLGHSGATDVISFGFTRATPSDPVIGDIYICPDVARENAAARGAGVREEIGRLVVHGVLHVLGHDHPVDERRESSAMWKRQEQLLRRLMMPGMMPGVKRR